MNKKILCIIFCFFITSCRKNNPILSENFQALRCESTNKEKKYDDYVFNANTGYLYFYDQIKNEFNPLSERFESGYFSENTREFFSVINKNNLLITNIEYYEDLNKNQEFLKKYEIINLKSLIKKSIYKNKIGEYIASREKCIWIDPKLGIRY